VDSGVENSSSVVDTSLFRSTTPLLRLGAYLLLFIHLARFAASSLCDGTGVALSSRVEGQKDFSPRTNRIAGNKKQNFYVENCFEG
jgi:hypothetical protein